ncbi:MAG TPA: DUF134 domain-containing protein [Candidatus Absconditabacterales bacterium]|nr:DUF134 domain-containing protein [Candidatus Absconditabacterales bacterium]
MNGFGCGRGRGRMKKNRRVNFQSNVDLFKPIGIPRSQLEETVLGHDEVETLRLKNIEKMDVVSGAKEMEISKSTFARIYKQAVDKLSDAIINGKAISIEK